MVVTPAFSASINALSKLRQLIFGLRIVMSFGGVILAMQNGQRALHANPPTTTDMVPIFMALLT
jgi:uncharacterized protein YneF (UPF0154 family)